MKRRPTPKDRASDVAEREKGTHYRILANQMQEGIAILKMRPLRIVFANKFLANICGSSARALASLSPEEAARRIYSASKATMLADLRRRLSGRGAPRVHACRIVRKDGTVCYVDISSRKVTYEGSPAVQATFIDRTPRKKLSLLSQAVEQIAEGIAVVTTGGMVIYNNRAFAAMHGYGTRSLAGKHLSVFHTPKQMPVVKAMLAQTKTTGHSSGEVWHARLGGTCFPTLMQTALLHDENGKASGMVGTCRDITSLKKAADELARSKKEKTLILDSVEESITYKDSGMRIVWANWAAARRAGVTPRELIGKRCHEVWHGIARPCPKCPGLMAMRTGEPAWGEVIGKHGRHYLIGAYPAKDAEGRTTGNVEVAIEVGDRHNAKEMANLRSFSKMLIDLQEEERRRIALELHDQVGQSLTVAKLYLQRIERECRRDGRGVMCEFADAISLIDAAVSDVRTISHRLRPPGLDILGLVSSLEQLMKSVSGKSGVEIDFAARGIRGKLDARLEIALYRVVQEAVNNALKYSGCTRIGISLRAKGGGLALRVTDNGKGFALLRASRITSLGITGMRERIEGVGGVFTVRSGPGEGTRIDALVPLTAAARRVR